MLMSQCHNVTFSGKKILLGNKNKQVFCIPLAYSYLCTYEKRLYTSLYI